MCEHDHLAMLGQIYEAFGDRLLKALIQGGDGVVEDHGHALFKARRVGRRLPTPRYVLLTLAQDFTILLGALRVLQLNVNVNAPLPWDRYDMRTGSEWPPSARNSALKRSQ
jgi:hypothetical protein